MGSEQHYSLRWNDYTVKIVTAFQSLRDEEDFVDVTVACDGHSYSAHKMVLSACSPYFRALLRANPCQHPIVILKDVGHVELERLLEFMYNGEVSIAQDQLAAFLRTAENLKIRGLAGSSDDMDQLGLQRPDVSYSYSSCSIGGAGGTSGRSSPSAGYAPSQGSKDEEVGGDGSGGYHARAESPPSKRRKRLSAPAAGHADLNTETHSSECVVEATVEIESGGSLSGTLPGEDDVRQDRRELKSEPGDVMAEVYSETSELTDPTSHSGEGLDPRQSVLYPLALPGPSGAAGNPDSVGPHESGAGALVVAWATMVEEGSSGGGGGVGALGKSKPLSLGDAVDAASGECAMTTANSSGGGRLYPCPDCEKVFRHPRSYYQHQHVHRGTHSCPGCGKLFSRRWDLLRHLNKNKYGCPARWREGNRHPPYHNSLSLSALASAAAVAASSQEGLLPPSEAPDHQQPLHQPAVSWTVPSVATGGVSGRQHSSRSSSSGSNGEPRPPEPPTASRTSP
ncbi:longitudinals lacking protein, isoforms H/M/V-like isoform X11 [Macrobrachium nipponense]|uniref:longitudinals lacking protein, isoforms H/M/V-like isoform X11 n=1 Tax=Macrobrachium nipponense TaxID=159736 RepID=UPI0030C8C367